MVQWQRLLIPNAGGLCLISGQGIRASLVAQSVKILPAMQETWV